MGLTAGRYGFTELGYDHGQTLPRRCFFVRAFLLHASSSQSTKIESKPRFRNEWLLALTLLLWKGSGSTQMIDLQQKGLIR